MGGQRFCEARAAGFCEKNRGRKPAASDEWRKLTLLGVV
jgi:hypothetical protein